MARPQSILSHGGILDGRRVLSGAAIEMIFREQARGTDLVLGFPVRYGLVCGLPIEPGPVLLPGRVCFRGGAGGSCVADLLDERCTFTYVMNRMGPGFPGDDRNARLLVDAVDALRSRGTHG